MAKIVLKIVSLALSFLVIACSTPNPEAIDYKSPKHSKAPSLATPPDLTEEAHTHQAQTPTHTALLSNYDQNNKGVMLQSIEVLPPTPGFSIQREGSQRWLVVEKMPSDVLWEKIRNFWQAQGFILTSSSKEDKTLETDWKETRPSFDLGTIRNLLSKAVNSMYVTGERNRYRTRVETKANGSSSVFISQQGLREVLSGTNNELSRWIERPNDPNLEALFLQRLQRALANKDQENGLLSQNGAPAKEKSSIASNNNASEKKDLNQKKENQFNEKQTLHSHIVLLPLSYDRAWLKVGIALDQAHFTINDRNRTQGLYYINYVDPNDKTSQKQGFWNQVFHGKKEMKAIQYQINVRALTENQTSVKVVDKEGKQDNSRAANQIINLIKEAL